jgi:hypothetical protein
MAYKKDNDNETSARAKSREKRLAERRAERQSRGKVDFDALHCAELRTLTAYIIEMGGAIRIGATRDGGAYAIGVYGFGEPFTEYCGASEDFSVFCGQLASDLMDA